MTAAYTNIHGQPLSLSARDAVLAIEPDARAARERLVKGEIWKVWRTGHPQASLIGTGSTEESAWREAWSRMLAEEVVKGSQA